MKFLIDECLSPQLAHAAATGGYPGSSHVQWLGLAGRQDWELMPTILDGDWTFVTRNAIDFRGPAARQGETGQYSDVAVHAGLICLMGPQRMDRPLQLELFGVALTELARDPDLVNQVLEVSLDEDEQIAILRYELPATP